METLTQTPCVACDSRAYGSFETVEIDGTAYRVCDHCLLNADGPGKFEGCRHSTEELALALTLYALTLDGMVDSQLTDEYAGSVARIGRYLLVEDERGFVEVREFADADKAEKELNGYEDDGFGADESDAWISFERGGYGVSFDGKYLATYDRLSRAKAAVSVEMRKSGYYPNVFLTGEHGPSVRRIDVW